jgi:hypothetical protein
MTIQQANEKALAAVTSRHFNGTEFEVTHTRPEFLDGILVFIQFYDEDEADDENYVYITDSDTHLMTDYEEVAALVAQHRPASSSHRLLRELMHVGGIAGFVAVLITITICYMLAFKDAKEIPQILSGALTTILGFYFGSKVSKN